MNETMKKYQNITSSLIESHRTISVMESCTAGLIASLLTDVEGASEVFLGGIVSYSNAAKESVGVSDTVIRERGVYSPETALAMADTARDHFKTEIAVGVTGTFGNADPNNADSVPGEVHFAVVTETERRSVKIAVPLSLKRHEAKMFAADKIADELMGVL